VSEEKKYCLSEEKFRAITEPCLKSEPCPFGIAHLPASSELDWQCDQCHDFCVAAAESKAKEEAMRQEGWRSKDERREQCRTCMAANYTVDNIQAARQEVARDFVDYIEVNGVTPGGWKSFKAKYFTEKVVKQEMTREEFIHAMNSRPPRPAFERQSQMFICPDANTCDSDCSGKRKHSRSPFCSHKWHCHAADCIPVPEIPGE